LHKRGFIEVGDSNFNSGKVGFFCNMCESTQVSFVNAFHKRCKKRASKSYPLISKYSARYTESFVPRIIDLKFDHFIMTGSL